MIAFDVEGVRFNYCVGGFCVVDGQVLLQRADFEDFWYLPGGRPEPLETSRETLVREIIEELGVEVEVHELLWIVENFFQYNNKSFHELGLYYLITFPSVCSINDLSKTHCGTEPGGIELIYQWFPVNSLDEVRLFPKFLRTSLAKPPSVLEHVVQETETLWCTWRPRRPTSGSGYTPGS